jgi:hypothetical protein
MDQVLIKNNGIDPKWSGTHFLSQSTWFDPYWPSGLSFDPKQLETHFLPLSTWFDPYWPGWLDFDQKITVLTKNGLKLIFWPGRHGLTCNDLVSSFFLWKKVVDQIKIYFWILNFSLIFWIFMNKNRNEITFKKILKNLKLSYYKWNEGFMLNNLWF